jgi:hypothetical protein
VAAVLLSECAPEPSSSDKQRDRQEKIVAEAAAQVGMPALTNFRELKMVKDIYELRDQTGLITYTYLVNEFSGKLIFFCDSIGYGMPYATQFSAPTSMQRWHMEAFASGQTADYGIQQLPQAEPNGLFVPDSAEGTWVMCKDPNGSDVRPVYVEPRIVVSQFEMPCSILVDGCAPEPTAEEAAAK